MLILTRRLGEKVLIGDEITVQVLEVNRNQVRVAINAPRDVLILREELKGKPFNDKRLLNNGSQSQLKTLPRE